MSVKEIDASELQSRINAGEDILLFDIRSKAEIAQGTLPNAEHLEMHMIPLRMNDLPKDKDIVLYCRSGARSHQACDYMVQQGVENVTSLRGGITAWASQGYTVASPDEPKAT